MGWFRKKRDPASEYARTLNAEISSLEEQIKLLSAEIQNPGRSDSAAPAGPASRPEPVFEPVDRQRLEHPAEPDSKDNRADLGVRHRELISIWDRLQNYLRRPGTSNPKLVQYLAAGSVQGLRPLRYEKRVARRRLIGTVALLLLALWGVLYSFKWRH